MIPLCWWARSEGSSSGITCDQRAPSSVVRATAVGMRMLAGAGTPWPCEVAIGPNRTVPFGVTATGAVSVVGPAWVRHGTGASRGWRSSTRPPDVWATAGRAGWQPGPGASARAPPAASSARHAPRITARRPITHNNARTARRLRLVLPRAAQRHHVQPEPAADLDRLRGDVGRLLGGQERDEVRDLGGLAQPPHRERGVDARKDVGRHREDLLGGDQTR